MRQLKVLQLALIVCVLGSFAAAQGNYGSYRDSGVGLYSNQGFCNEVTPGVGVLGCAPVVLSTTYTTTAQATANVTTDQNLVNFGLQPSTLTKVGKTLIVKGSGTYSLGVASVITLKVKVCSVSGCASGNVVTPCTWATASNANTGVVSSFNFECVVGLSTVSGVNSKLLGHGTLGVQVGAANTAALAVFGDVTTAETAVFDATVTQFVQTTVTFATANAGNTMTQNNNMILLGAPIA